MEAATLFYIKNSIQIKVNFFNLIVLKTLVLINTTAYSILKKDCFGTYVNF